MVTNLQEFADIDTLLEALIQFDHPRECQHSQDAGVRI